MSKFCGAIRVMSIIYHPHNTNLVDLLGDTETKKARKCNRMLNISGLFSYILTTRSSAVFLFSILTNQLCLLPMLSFRLFFFLTVQLCNCFVCVFSIFVVCIPAAY